MIAANEVLKCQRVSKSLLTFRMVWWSLRSSARSASFDGSPFGEPLPDTLRVMKRYTRPRKRYMPSTPESCQSKSFSGGAAKRENSRTVSAP